MQSSAKSLKRIKLTAIALTLAIGFAGFYATTSRDFRAAAYPSGAPPSHTGAPGETNCTECHYTTPPTPVNGGPGSVAISGLPANYAPGVSYLVTVTVTQQGQVVFGFQTTALDNINNQQAGSFTVPGGTNPQMKIINGNIGNPPNNTRNYVEQTSFGITPTQFNTKSWTFNWQAPATRKGKITFYAAGNAADGNNAPSNDYIYTTTASVCSGTVQSNFDGDGKADIAVFRPSNGIWFRLNSSTGQISANQFGLSEDKIVPGDYDGDGKNDIAVWRPSNGVWYILRSSDGTVVSQQFGASSDIPVVGDFTGDGKSDLAVFRPSTGVWYTYNLANNAVAATQFGLNGDKPLSGDFDGDGKSDDAVYRPSTGVWYVLRSSNNSQTGVQWGASGDRAVPGDYDGDGKTDYAVFRPSNGVWYLLRSTAGFSATQFGLAEDQPVPTDYDGDCKTDIAVFRPSLGAWYYLYSGDNSFHAQQFGLSTDVPVPSATVSQ